MILDWNHLINFNRDITQFSKLCFTKSGNVYDMHWTNKHGVEYRDNLLPSHIALRPNRFNNCWYINYNSHSHSHMMLPKDNVDNNNNVGDVINFVIYCCDS